MNAGQLPPLEDGRVVCECSRDNCLVLARFLRTDEGLTLRFDRPTDHFVLTGGTIALLVKDRGPSTP